MIIAISGSNGFIGSELTSCFREQKNEVRRIRRIDAKTPVHDIVDDILGADVIINLAGAPIVNRWTQTYKKLLFDSRIITTAKMVEAIKTLDKKPELFISTSAVGIYSQSGKHSENNFHPADDYLAEICEAWETEAGKALPYTRVVIARLGIVLGKGGGALSRIIPLFKLGLGGKIGNGKQGFSWIHIQDVIGAIQFLIENKQLSGNFNFTAPDLVDNAAFTGTLAEVLKRPAYLPVPLFGLKMLFGEGSIAVAGGQFAYPENLINAGYQYCYPELDAALREIIS